MVRGNRIVKRGSQKESTVQRCKHYSHAMKSMRVKFTTLLDMLKKQFPGDPDLQKNKASVLSRLRKYQKNHAPSLRTCLQVEKVLELEPGTIYRQVAAHEKELLSTLQEEFGNIPMKLGSADTQAVVKSLGTTDTGGNPAREEARRRAAVLRTIMSDRGLNTASLARMIVSEPEKNPKAVKDMDYTLRRRAMNGAAVSLLEDDLAGKIADTVGLPKETLINPVDAPSNNGAASSPKRARRTQVAKAAQAAEGSAVNVSSGNLKLDLSVRYNGNLRRFEDENGNTIIEKIGDAFFLRTEVPKDTILELLLG